MTARAPSGRVIAANTEEAEQPRLACAAHGEAQPQHRGRQQHEQRGPEAGRRRRVVQRRVAERRSATPARPWLARHASIANSSTVPAWAAMPQRIDQFSSARSLLPSITPSASSTVQVKLV
jgi:hypothetical protein